MSGGEPRPLRDRPPGVRGPSGYVGAVGVRPTHPLLRPARRRLLPCLLPAIDGPIEQQAVARCHHLDPAPVRPVGLEDPLTLAQIEDQVEAVEGPACEQ